MNTELNDLMFTPSEIMSTCNTIIGFLSESNSEAFSESESIASSISITSVLFFFTPFISGSNVSTSLLMFVSFTECKRIT